MDINLSLGNTTSVVTTSSPYVSLDIFMIMLFVSLSLLIISRYRIDIFMSGIGIVFSIATTWASLSVASVGYATATSGSTLSVVPVVTMVSSVPLTVMCVILVGVSIVNLIYIISEMSHEVTKKMQEEKNNKLNVGKRI